MSRKPLIIGHRGASAVAPENTLAAFRLALAQNADGVEFDVRLTRDKIPVVIHDDDLRRTGSIPDRVADLSLADLKKVDVGSWFDRKQTTGASFSGETIPTLEEVFALFESTNALLYLEMKSDASQRDELAHSCCDTLKRSSLKQRVIVECFDLEAIAAVKKIDNEIRTAALFEPTLKTSLAAAASGRKLIERSRIVSADEVALHHTLATPRIIAAAHEANLQVIVWTVDNTDWLKRAASLRIAALITNDPGMMVAQRDQINSD